jgi:uncharacterized C2H2 Zn-finger protein
LSTKKTTKFKCPDCKLTFPNASLLGVHRRNIHKIAGTAPQTIRAREARISSIAHIPRDAQGNLICPECKVVTTSYAGFAQHRTKAHGVKPNAPLPGQKLPEPFPVEPVKKPIQCALCEATFNLRDTYNKHLLRIHDTTMSALKIQEGRPVNGKFKPSMAQKMLEGEFPCPHCDFIGRWKGGLTLHMTKTHKNLNATNGTNPRSELVSQTEAHPIATNGHHQEAQAGPDAHPDFITAIAFGRFTEFCRCLATEYDLSTRDLTDRLIGAILQSQVRNPSRNSNRVSALR